LLLAVQPPDKSDAINGYFGLDRSLCLWHDPFTSNEFNVRLLPNTHSCVRQNEASAEAEARSC
jgi:hypothetical protein